LDAIAAEEAAYEHLLAETIAFAESHAGEFEISSLQHELFNHVTASTEQAHKFEKAAKAYIEYTEGEAHALADEADAIFSRGTLLMEAIAGLGIVLGIAIGWFVSNFGIVRPIGAAVDGLQKLAQGDTDFEITGTDRHDEIGEIARTMDAFRDNIAKSRELEASQANDQRDKEARQQRVETYIAGFEQSVIDSLEALSAAATQMQATSENMTMIADDSAGQATAVAAAAEEASTNVQTVASASEELSSSVSEISRQVSDSHRIAEEAVSQAQHTNTTIQGLSDAAQKIDDVIGLISGIAEQTNLLALNATIEAARAGEAGKGFAVVASEVKALATQTGKATEDIATLITSMRSATGESVNAIEAISGTIEKMNEISNAIAAAIEEQGAATQEIATNVQQAAIGTQEVSSNISGVTDSTVETKSAAEQVKVTAGELSQQSQHLRGDVDTFLENIRAA
jgi:methyl-accepting chemotaxis protein